MPEMTEITLPGGLIIKGTKEQLDEALATLRAKIDDGVHYLSASRGVLNIDEMHPNHIKNAILRIYLDWLEDKRNLDWPEFFNAIAMGPDSNTMKALVKTCYEKTMPTAEAAAADTGS